jgi:hypothetical protein
MQGNPNIPKKNRTKRLLQRVHPSFSVSRPLRISLLNRSFFTVSLLMAFAAENSWGRIFDDQTGYLSRRKYDLSSLPNPENQAVNSTAQIEILDPDAPDKNFDLRLSFSTRGSTLQDGNVQSSLSASFVGVDFNWNVTNWLKAHFLGGYQFAAGNAANVFGTEGNPYTGEAFDEAAFIANFGRFELAGGVIETEMNPWSSTFDAGGYAGLRQSWNLDSGNFKGSFRAFQVAASAGGTANRALDDEKSPLLTIANLNAGMKFDKFAANFSFSKYDFFGMTSGSAGASRFIGNTVIGEGNGIVFYRYKFRGQEVAGKAVLTLRLDDSLGVSGNMTQNNEAPARRNFGWIARGFYEYNFGRYSIRPSITRFRFEPDLMPAYASVGSLGFLNRDGYAGEIRAALKKYKLEAYVRYLDAKEVEPKPAQSDRIGLTVGLEVKYVIL